VKGFSKQASNMDGVDWIYGTGEGKRVEGRKNWVWMY
jgi:hypothetical protein